jgi:hypothetical protein
MRLLVYVDSPDDLRNRVISIRRATRDGLGLGVR